MCVNKFSLAGKSALVICPENNWGPEVVQGLKAAGCKVFLAGPNEEAMKAMDAAGCNISTELEEGLRALAPAKESSDD